MYEFVSFCVKIIEAFSYSGLSLHPSVGFISFLYILHNSSNMGKVFSVCRCYCSCYYCCFVNILSCTSGSVINCKFFHCSYISK